MVSRRAFLKLTGVGLAAGCGVDPLTGAPPASPSPNDPLAGAGDGSHALDLEGHGLEERAPVVVEPPESVAESALFPLGVSAGDVDVDAGVVGAGVVGAGTVTLWARYDGEAPLELVVWRMALDVVSGAHSLYAGVHRELPAAPAAGGFVHVDVDGLVAGARYRYAFFERDESGARAARSVIGRFRAGIAADEPLVIGAVSCTDESEGEFNTLARAAERELDVFLLLGDTAYCDGAFSIDEYREKWAAHTGKAGHVALRASTSVYATWDDHEVKNDWDPERIEPEQLATARAAFFENLPVRTEGEPGRIWRSRRWGTTAEIFVLDSRSERLPSTIFSDDEQYLSRAQMDWLKQALLDSPCRFKVIMNSVPITRFPNVWNAWQVDRWDAYDAQRTEILTHIDDNAVAGVLWVSGDFHLAKMGFVSPEGQPGASQVEVLVGPGAQSGNPLVTTLIDSYFHWKSTENNYTELHLDPSTGEARIVYVDATGAPFAERVYAL